MLKRYQVLLEDWLGDYVKHLAEIYDISFSEAIRAALCIEFIDTANIVYKYKTGITKTELLKTMREAMKKPQSEEAQHKIISKLYFKGRKAVEFRLK